MKSSNNKIKLLFVFTSCRNCGPIQVMYNLFKYIDKDKFELNLITLYEENENSRLKEFLPFCNSYIKCKMSKLDILFRRNKHLYENIDRIQPQILHAMGVFAEYSVNNYTKVFKVLTLHNYMKYDYISKFGFIRGNILIYLQKKSISTFDHVWTCSKSLSQLYLEDGNDYDYIVNGVDGENYYAISRHEKISLRRKLGISEHFTVYISSGQFIKRKDQETIIKGFLKAGITNSMLILLGNGPLLEGLKKKYCAYRHIIFVGNVNNVCDYLQSSDVYISAAHAEGMPMGVLEAVSCGLYVILSDILPHREILDNRNIIGASFSVDDYEDCSEKIEKSSDILKKINSGQYENLYADYFTAKRMAKDYEDAYIALAGEIS